MMQRQPCHTDGFTLVELMSAVAIMTILVAISWQAMQGPLQEQRLRQAAVELADLLNTARTTAAKNSYTCKIEQQTVSGVLVYTRNNTSEVPYNCFGSPGVANASQQLYLNPSLIVTSNLVISGANAFTFTKYGTLDGATSLTTVLGVSSGTGTSWQWCIDVSAPAAIVRVGTRANASSTCNYLRQ